ncbi:DUF1127 domain-containing protein [Shimia thalassica]|uniref:YjiS-like domain-containing protein n=1 Tax=Shimia thalassica TaxID=1715693 RepID=A0A0P1IH92_9RHOB|nr:DUF1127 domain-containing protein [Shimia thalassica]PHO03532.1 DUF1127 domain-containing protein [Rhodobacteraceae bacterium 4F10]MBU2942038.1 DUF1127 domain-containing protein [Shimia thalassica]MDO6478236.1 DUF1127 domain-containing protein [Shimia thalassica]MDO6482945.1 DUF1127 domain-containing protein [Shimia thalassica]MDO6502993.1 DUF1127 domain-containing protein [Shimia thalassica]
MVQTAHHSKQLISFAQDYPLPVVARWAVAFAVTVTTWDRRVRTRRALARLDAARLQDVGISLQEAKDEAAKMFWRG